MSQRRRWWWRTCRISIRIDMIGSRRCAAVAVHHKHSPWPRTTPTVRSSSIESTWPSRWTLSFPVHSMTDSTVNVQKWTTTNEKKWCAIVAHVRPCHPLSQVIWELWFFYYSFSLRRGWMFEVYTFDPPSSPSFYFFWSNGFRSSTTVFFLFCVCPSVCLYVFCSKGGVGSPAKGWVSPALVEFKFWNEFQRINLN